MSRYDFCLKCMTHKGDAAQCPKCGYNENTPRKLPALTPGTLLADRYVAGCVIAENGEGFTYIAMDTRLDRKVTIREFLPQNLCTRENGSDAVVVSPDCREAYSDFMEDFTAIGQAVKRMNGKPGIAQVLDMFACNNTQYIVYEYVQGTTLTELVRRAKSLTWDEAKPIFMPLINTLSAAHSIGLVHFGICPDNIYMTPGGTLSLTGYSVPSIRMAETELDAELYDGYSALEQYSADGSNGAWSDVYALSAVILFALTGKRLPDAVSRTYEPKLPIPAQLAEIIPTYVLTALAGGLQVRPENRTRTMDALAEALSSRGGVSDSRQSAPAQQRRPSYNDEPAREQRRPAPSEPQRRPNPAPAAAKAKSGETNGDTAWYKNLSQFQYWLLTTCLGIIVLGTIAVIVFLNIRPLLKQDNKKPVVVDDGFVSTADVGLEADLYVVPDFRGMVWADTKSNPDYLMFDLIELREVYSDDYAAGQIAAQSVAPQSEVQRNSPIAITVSLGSELCPIPNIIGKTVLEADEELTAAGLVLGKQSEEYNSGVERGRVIAIDGSSVGTRIKRGSEVAIIVSLGSEG